MEQLDVGTLEHNFGGILERRRLPAQLRVEVPLETARVRRQRVFLSQGPEVDGVVRERPRFHTPAACPPREAREPGLVDLFPVPAHRRRRSVEDGPFLHAPGIEAPLPVWECALIVADCPQLVLEGPDVQPVEKEEPCLDVG